MRWPFLPLAALLAACATSGPLSALEVQRLATRTWQGPTDEVFDASWLALTGRGFEVLAHDRLAGTLTARRDGRTWALDVAALGSEQRVTLTPDSPVSRAELDQVLEALDEGTARLLSAWREVPEWKFDGRRNLLTVPGLHLEPPRAWEWLDFDVSHREVTVQRSRARTGPNPTLRVEVERARPVTRLPEAAALTLGLALGARQRLTLPDELKQGVVRVLDGTIGEEAVWFGLEEQLGPQQVRVTLACPAADAEACREAWRSLAVGTR